MLHPIISRRRNPSFSDSTSSASQQDDLIFKTQRESIIVVRSARHELTGSTLGGDENFVYLKGVGNGGSDVIIAEGYSSFTNYDKAYGYQMYTVPAGTEVRVAWTRGISGGTSQIQILLDVFELE